MNKINLKQIFLWGQQEPELTNKLREFGALPKVNNVNCSTCGAPMHLYFDKKKMNLCGVATKCISLVEEKRKNVIIKKR